MNGYQKQQLVTKRYRQSAKGVLTRLFNSQRWNCKHLKRKQPSYSLEQLQNKFLHDKRFLRIYRSWVKGGYLTPERPSIDRIDSFKSYTLDNIQVLTWEKNYIKSLKERIYPHRHEVYMCNSEGKILRKFKSITLAAKTVGSTLGNISMVCNGARRSSAGYKWKFGKKIRNRKHFE